MSTLTDISPAVSVRLSSDDDDREAVRRLAELAHRPPPRGPVMLAEAAGEPVAAVGIADGSSVADPSRATPGILTLLHLRRVEARVIVAIWGV